MPNLTNILPILACWLCALFLMTIQSTAATPGNFDSEKIESFKKKSEYNYYQRKQATPEEPTQEGSSAHLNIDFGWADGVVTFVLVLIFVGILGGLAYVFAQGGFKQVFLLNRQLKTHAQIEQLLNEDKIHTNDFDPMIAAAKKTKNHRLVLRLMFLKALQNLNQKQQIIYAKNKTNDEYSYEIKNTILKTNFDEISGIFSWVWYGHTQIDESTFEEFEPKFKTFIADIEAI